MMDGRVIKGGWINGLKNKERDMRIEWEDKRGGGIRRNMRI